MDRRRPFRGRGDVAAPPSLRVVDLRGTYGNVPYPTRPLRAVTAYIVHHSETPEPQSEQEAIQQIASIHAFHQSVRGWPGFAYNDAIWRSTYFLCRPSTRMGWHSAGTDQNQNGIGDWNEKGHAVVLLGSYGATTPSVETRESILEGKVLTETEVGKTLELRGHRSGWPTRCPGDWWPAWSASQGGV